MRLRTVLVCLLLVSMTGGAWVAAPAASADVGGQRWSVNVAGGWFHWSSPAIADVDGDGSNDVVVGGLNGRLYAYDAAGAPVPGWSGGAPATAAVASSPAVGDLDGDGRNEVVVGVGAIEVPNQQGALNIFNANGTRRCSINTRGPELSQGTAVFAAPAIGDVNGDGRMDVVFGSFDHHIRVVDGNCRQLAIFNSKDSVWSSPALHDVGGNGTAEIFIGVDASRNPQTGESLNGGYFRALRWNPGYRHPDGHQNIEQYWERRSTETFQSAAAIGDVNGDGRLEAVTGSGAYWCRHFNQCADSDKVWAFHLDNGSDVPGWPKAASYETTFLSAPALGDIDGDGRTDVVIGTNRYDRASAGKNPSGGAVDAFYGDPGKGRRTWVSPDVEVMASPVIADITGEGMPEVLVGTASQVFALGSNLGVHQKGIATSPHVNHKASVAVGRLGSTWALVSTGFDGSRSGNIQVHDIPTPASAPWPMHRKNPLRNGAEYSSPVLPDTGFYDVPDSSIYAEAVTWASDAGITGGCTATNFCPTRNVTRAQAAAFLWRHAGEPAAGGAQFSDVRTDAYYADAVRWVRDEGITLGCTSDTFCPNGTATRAQLVTFLWRHAGSPGTDGDHGFTDVRAGAYYVDAVTWAVDNGITTGTSSTEFSPNDRVTRGQTVLFLHRYLA